MNNIKFQDIINDLNTNHRSELNIYETLTEEQVESLANALRHNTSLIQLYLYSNDINAAGVRMIADALKDNTTLTSFDLCNNNIGDAGAEAIVEAFKHNSTLRSLCLNDNNIGDAGALKIAETLKHTRISSLGLQWNNIGNVGAGEIAKALIVNTTLFKLNLHKNNIGDAGILKIAEALKINTRLSALSVGTNKIGDIGAEEIAQALIVNSTLSGLSLSDNNISDAGAEKIADALIANTCLSSFDISRNKISDEGFQKIAGALIFNTELKNVRYNGMNYHQNMQELLSLNKEIAKIFDRDYFASNNTYNSIQKLLQSKHAISSTTMTPLASKLYDPMPIVECPSLIEIAANKGYTSLVDKKISIKEAATSLPGTLFSPLIKSYYENKNKNENRSYSRLGVFNSYSEKMINNNATQQVNERKLTYKIQGK